MNPQPLATAALDIGRCLLREAAWTHPGAVWRGRDVRETGTGPNDWTVIEVDLGPDLYAGTTGIATVLAAFGQLDPQGPWLAAATTAMHRALTDPTASMLETGWFSGRLGIVAAALRIGAQADDRALTAIALDELDRLVVEIGDRTPAQSDLVDGIAGHILGLLSLRLDPARRTQVVALAVALAETLRSRSARGPWGWSWSTVVSEHGLASLAHGGSGIGLALMEAGVAAGRPDLIEGGREAFRFERTWLGQERPGWPDLRGHYDSACAAETIDPYVTALWCHGSAGVGLARLRAYELLREPIWLAEAGTALLSARRMVADLASANREPIDGSLCHGLAGVVELYLEAARVLGVREHLRAARRTAQLLVDRSQSEAGWACGLPDRSPTTGLFLGRAGIGLSLVRAVEPNVAASAALPGAGTGVLHAIG